MGQPTRKMRLTESAVRLLETQGPAGVTARKVAAEAGTTSMSVYTDFGSMGGLVASVVDHGYDQLADLLTPLPVTEDPLVDLWRAALTLRSFALQHRHLYTVMFSAESAGGHQRAGKELLQGIHTLRHLEEILTRAQRVGLLEPGPPRTITLQFWIAVHGHLMLELAGYIGKGREAIYRSTVRTTLRGLGARPDNIQRALADSLPPTGNPDEG